MNNIYKNKGLRLKAFAVCLLMVVASVSYGQKKKKKNSKVTFNAQIVEGDNLPVEAVKVSYLNGTKWAMSNEDGRFNILTVNNDVLVLEKDGYETIYFTVKNDNLSGRVMHIEKRPWFLSSNDNVELPHTNTYKRMMNGAVAEVDGEVLESFPSASLGNALAGQAAGLYIRQQGGRPGSAKPKMNIRGQHTGSDNSIVVYIDGVKRDINDLNAEEIDKVYVLKDASSKILAGPEAINGALWVTTKRGEAEKRNISVTAETGIQSVGVMPEYLNAYDYARLYNEARANDGLTPYYSDEYLQGYQSGSNPLKYPDNDYWADYYKNASRYSKVAAQFSGGSQEVKYYVNLGYTGEGGLEDIGQESTYDRLNMRANLDVDVTKAVTLKADIASSMEFFNRAGAKESEMFNVINKHRPNEYPVYLSEARGDSALFGASYAYNRNIVGMMTQSGYVKETNRVAQMNFGLDFDLSSIAEGLSAETFVGFDTRNYLSYGKDRNFDSYITDWVKGSNAQDTMVYVYRVSNRKDASDQERKADDVSGQTTVRGKLSYTNGFGKTHYFNGNLLGVYYYNRIKGKTYKEDSKNTVFALNGTYMFKQRYMANLNLAYYGSPAFEDGERYALFPTIDLGWVMSEENFLSGSDVVDYLKLKASYGMMGTDRSFNNYYYYRSAWQKNESIGFGENLTNSMAMYKQVQAASNGLGWEKSTEINAGFDAVLFDNALRTEVNVFHELRSDILTQRNSLYPSGAVVPFVNYEEVSNQGIDFNIQYQNNIGELHYLVGANGVYSKTENKVIDEVVYPNGVQRSQRGLPVDAYMGYQAMGLFYDNNEVAASPFQSFGPYQQGDIRYQDVNNNGVVDADDQKEIGNYYPRFTFGFNAVLNYKGFELYALFTGAAGYDIMLDNSYYQVYGERKYSNQVWGRWTEATKDVASYPRLTTQSDGNNFKSSSYWLEKGDYIKLKNVELSYSLPQSVLNKLSLQKMKVFVRGTNLFTLSKIKDSDPEDIMAGISGYPLFSGYTGGISLTF
ncbi:MAG: SusC/RagA family TonB-linked outer membrane protein [Carboxylicivirga sp.]|jgi:TonB-linked SusC/RagA family outer membrane protein|nr:SusC/RagA family TonB-linked outer membrane protein [Carboxylicivirga sp.]